MLDNFRKIDLVWNNAYEKLGNVRTAQYDEKGRKLVVQVTNGGDIIDLTGTELKLVTIDGIEVGGRNLLLDSSYIRYVQGTEVEYKGHLATKLTAPSNTNHTPRPPEVSEDFIEGKTYTYSVLVAFEGEKPDNIQLYLSPLSSYTNADGFEDIEEGKYGRIYITRKATRDGGLLNPHLHIIGGDGHVYFTKWRIEKGNKATDWTPAPEDLQFPFDLVDPSRGIYELYIPKLFVDRYTGDTKVFLELTTKDFSVTSEPFYINVFEGVR